MQRRSRGLSDQHSTTLPPHQTRQGGTPGEWGRQRRRHRPSQGRAANLMWETKWLAVRSVQRWTLKVRKGTE